MRRLMIPALAALSLAALSLAGAAPAQEALSPEEAAAVDARVRAYLLENPEIILEALDVLERRRQDAQTQADVDLVAQNAAALFEDGFSHVFGNPEGDVTVVKFSDYRCGYCKAAHPVMEELVASDPNLRLIVKEFPILGPDSTLAARAAMAALTIDPAKYEAFHDAMLSLKGGLDEATVFRLASEAGLEEAELRLAMEEPAIAEHLRDTLALAQRLGLEGTPSFVVGTRILRGFAQADQMRALIAEARESRG